MRFEELLDVGNVKFEWNESETIASAISGNHCLAKYNKEEFDVIVEKSLDHLGIDYTFVYGDK